MSDLEKAMAFQIKATGLPEPVPEHRWHPERRWRFDLAWVDRKIAVEVEGGTWARGRHTSGVGFRNDAEKYNEAALWGWTVLRVTGDQIKSGQAIAWIERALI